MVTENKSFKPSLSLLDATMVVSGGMIGSGIFIVSADITRNTGSAGWLILVWIITGFMTITAALSYGELSGMFPKAGGQYVYLKEAWGKLLPLRRLAWRSLNLPHTSFLNAVRIL